jgi:hypothetical protein
MPQPAAQGFVTPQRLMILHPNLSSDSKHWESEYSKEPDWPYLNPGPIVQEMLQLWTEGSFHQFMPQPTFTSSSNTGSYFSTTTNPQWKLNRTTLEEGW